MTPSFSPNNPHSVAVTVIRVIKVLGEGGRTDERTALEDQLDADGYGS